MTLLGTYTLPPNTVSNLKEVILEVAAQIVLLIIAYLLYVIVRQFRKISREIIGITGVDLVKFANNPNTTFVGEDDTDGGDNQDGPKALLSHTAYIIRRRENLCPSCTSAGCSRIQQTGTIDTK